MLSQIEYQNFLSKISSNFALKGDYKSYCSFENDWLSYFTNIYLPNHNLKLPIRIFIAESAPKGFYPNQNFIFDKACLKNSISETTDKFLYRYYRGVFSNLPIASVKKLDKQSALVHLAKENILIIDLLPTHGIKLSTANRKRIGKILLSVCDYSRFTYFSNHNAVNYSFSIPPSLYAKAMCTRYLGKNYKEFENVNTGQGHAPSIEAIKRIISKGF